MDEKHKIDKLKIQGFKSLQDVELELGRLNVLIGPNGAGKSNFISYFQMLREMVEGRLQLWVSGRGGSDRILSYGIKETPLFESLIEFGQNAYKFALEPTVQGNFAFRTEDAYYDGTYRRFLGSGHIESKTQTIQSSDSKYTATLLFPVGRFSIFTTPATPPV